MTEVPQDYKTEKTSRPPYYLSLSILAIIVVSFLGMWYILEFGMESRDTSAFAANDLDGNTFTLADSKGKIVLLEWMATWCSTCKALLPTLKDFAIAYPSVQLISVSIDPSYDDSNRLATYISTNGLNYSNWLFGRDVGSYSGQWLVGSVPYLFLIDKDGNVVFENLGLISFETLEAWVTAVS